MCFEDKIDNQKQFLVYHNNDVICTGVDEEISLDEKELRKIEKKYNIKIVNKDEALDDNDLYAFLLVANKEYLLFQVMEGNIGDKNELSWKSVYFCKLFQDKKKKMEEEGFFDFNFWKQYFEDKRKFFDEEFTLNKVYMDEVRKVFPCLVYFRRFYDFLEMYETQGFYMEILDINAERIEKGKVSPYIGKKYNSLYHKYAQIRQIILKNDVVFEVCLIQGIIENGKMNIEKKGYAYISKNYVLNFSIEDLSDLMDSTLIYSQFHYEEFDKKYPDVKFKDYIKSGGKYYIPFLLSMNHNHTMELAGKARCGYIADRIYSSYFDLRGVNYKGSNLKKIFGFPIGAMRNLNKKELQFGAEILSFEFYQKVYKAQPSILNMNLTLPMSKFIEYESLHNNNFWTKEIKSKTFLNMLRYVSKMDMEEEKLYQDYLQMVRMQNLRDDGWTPENLRQAHDALIVYMNEKRESICNENFSAIVQTEKYQRFIWEYGNFCFLIPRDANDLVTESYQQRNCVRGYVNSVARGYTYIIFMRLKGRKSSSFVTIEVSSGMELRQVKGKGNSPINDNTCKIVKLWCEEKGIDYTNCNDVSEKRFRRYY